MCLFFSSPIHCNYLRFFLHLLCDLLSHQCLCLSLHQICQTPSQASKKTSCLFSCWRLYHSGQSSCIPLLCSAPGFSKTSEQWRVTSVNTQFDQWLQMFLREDWEINRQILQSCNFHLCRKPGWKIVRSLKGLIYEERWSLWYLLLWGRSFSLSLCGFDQNSITDPRNLS